jgi:hypothetical protein
MAMMTGAVKSEYSMQVVMTVPRSSKLKIFYEL